MAANKLLLSWLFFSISSLLVHCLSPSLSSNLDNADKTRMKSVVELPATLGDIPLANIYYSLNAQKLLNPNVVIKNADAICQHLQSVVNEQLESLFLATSAAKLLPKCQIQSTKHLTKVESQIKDDSSVQDIYRAAFTLLNWGRPLDTAKVSKSLGAALKKDESLFNSGLAFQLAAKFGKPEERTPFVEKIGDVIVQADEVDGKYLQFEGGLGITANIILGVYQLATVSNKPIGVTNEQALKFASYFLSRKFVLTQKGISELLEVLHLYTTNKFHIPVAISNFGSVAISPANAVLSVRISNVLGVSLSPLNVVADSATRREDKKVVWSKKTLQPVQGDSTIFALNFVDTKPPRGFYDVAITATPSKADSRLIGNSGALVNAIVLTQVEIVNAEISVADRDATGTGAVTKLEHPRTYTSLLEADFQQRLMFKFQIRDRTAKDLLTAHQTFVRFTNTETKQEVVFVAEADQSLTYKLELNLQTKAKDLHYNSGAYQITLIVGDSVISNPLEWLAVNQFNLTLPPAPAPIPPPKKAILTTHYTPKPEIKHLFREPEIRPPSLVSNAFSILALFPLIVLVGLWLKLGANISAFPLSLSSIIFHVGLASIFGLYVCFFLHLNMFQTCKYLAVIGLVTFLAGHSLLSKIAKK